MSLQSLYSELEKKEGELANLKTLRAPLSSLEGHTKTIGSALKEAAESMEKAGSIGNAPFDNGKTSEYAIDMESTHAKIEEALNLLNVEIRELEEEINSLRSEIRMEEARIAARRREEEARKAEEAQNRNSASKSNAGIMAYDK